MRIAALTRFGLKMLCAALVLAAAPAPAARGGPVTEEQRIDAYVRARMAEGDRALLAAAKAYGEAVALDPSSAEIASRGYRQAVLAGDKALALRAAGRLDESGRLPRDGVILLLIDALDRGKWAEARATIDRLEREENLAFVVPFMRSWVSLRDGPYDPPVVPVDKPYAVFAVRYLEEQLLLQRLAQGDASAASDAYTQAKGRGTALGPYQRAWMAVRFAEIGRRDLALELVDNSATGQDSEAALARAGKLYRHARFTSQSGLALLMHRLSLDLFGQGEAAATLSIARLASFADPANDDIRLTVARAALAADYPAVAAMEAGKVAEASPAWFAAQSIRLRAVMDQGQGGRAVEQARQLATKRGDAEAFRLLGDLLVQTGDFAGAAEAYGKAREQMADKNDAALLLQLGGALEQAGRWAEAKPLLEQVVTIAPDSAVALNHLGYALADRSEELPRAISLLEKANRLRPNEAAFIDSLGWALFRAGYYDKALPLIQDAVAAEPGNPELNEHLGDVLWAMGRRFEARYAWKAAMTGLNGEGDPRLRARIVRKLDDAGVMTATP